MRVAKAQAESKTCQSRKLRAEFEEVGKLRLFVTQGNREIDRNKFEVLSPENMEEERLTCHRRQTTRTSTW